VEGGNESGGNLQICYRAGYIGNESPGVGHLDIRGGDEVDRKSPKMESLKALAIPPLLEETTL
jgi:hypothetical protein